MGELKRVAAESRESVTSEEENSSSGNTLKGITS